MTACANAKTATTNVADCIKNAIKSRVDSAAFDSWIAPLSFSVDGNILSLIAHNQFACDFVRATYTNILHTFASEFGLSVRVCAGRPAHSISPRPMNDNAPRKEIITCELLPVTAPDATGFDSFVACDENAFAVNACKKFAAGKITFSPLFIYGADGCGKTLLAECLHGCAHGKTLMMTGSQFVAEFQRAITERNIFAFKDFVRNCDNFIMDDVQAICGKRATSEEFTGLLVDLVKMGKNIALFSNASPANLTGFDRRLQSLLASGLVADIVAPNKTVRRSIMTRANVPAAVADNLSGRISANGHIVSGVAKKIAAWRDMMDIDVTLDVAEKLLADVLTKQKTPLGRAREMAAKLGVSFDDVASPSRVRGVVRARQIIMAVLKQTTDLSLAEIGRIVGDRDHATVLYGLAQIEKQKQTDLLMTAEIEQLIHG